MSTEYLFIAGTHKTGTSTILGVLNSHPEVLIMYEYLNNYPKVSNSDHIYNKALSGKLNGHINSLKKKGDSNPITKILDDTLEIVSKNREHPYRFFGSKFAGLNKNLDLIRRHNCIYSIRDLKTWLAKPSINSLYSARRNKRMFTSTAADYTMNFIRTFGYDNCLRISMEEFVLDTHSAVSKIDARFGLDVLNYYSDWASKIKQLDDPNKLIWPDWNKHSSSFSTSGILDTIVQTSKNPVFDDICEIFYKYYNNLDGKYSKDEIKSDIGKLREFKINRKKHTSFKDVYSSFSYNNIVSDIPEVVFSRKVRELSMASNASSGKFWPKNFNPKVSSNLATSARAYRSNVSSVANKFVIPGYEPEKPILSRSSSVLTFGGGFAKVARDGLRRRNLEAYNIPCPEALESPHAMYEYLHWVFTGRPSSDGYAYPDSWYDEDDRVFCNELIRNSSALIFSFRLAEVWRNNRSGEVLWLGSPGDLSDSEFKREKVPDVFLTLEKIIDIIRKHTDMLGIIISVSPEPIKSTMESKSCLSVDCVSKSTLRVAADLLVSQERQGVYYWPYFESTRWLTGYLDCAAFGKQDNSVTSVNEDISIKLAEVFADYFVE